MNSFVTLFSELSRVYQVLSPVYGLYPPSPESATVRKSVQYYQIDLSQFITEEIATR